jgi:hypothetical protein
MRTSSTNARAGRKTTKPPLCPRADTIITHTRPAQVTPQSLPCSCEHKEELEVHDEANAKSGNKAWLSRRLHAAIVREQQ